MAIPVASAAGLAVGPARLQTFASEEDRLRLTPAAVTGMKALAKAWGLRGDEVAALLAVSPSTWDRMSTGGRRPALNQDQMTRISALVGIFKGLHLLFADTMADRWPRLNNSGPLFGNLSPVDAMIEGGIPVMIEVRRYVDALRGGL